MGRPEVTIAAQGREAWWENQKLQPPMAEKHGGTTGSYTSCTGQRSMAGGPEVTLAAQDREAWREDRKLLAAQDREAWQDDRKLQRSWTKEHDEMSLKPHVSRLPPNQARRG